MRQRQQEAPEGLVWSWRCPLFDESFSLVVYVLTVLAAYFTVHRLRGRGHGGDGG